MGCWCVTHLLTGRAGKGGTIAHDVASHAYSAFGVAAITLRMSTGLVKYLSAL